MKCKVKRFFSRSVPLILLCCIFVFALSPSASAVEWEDLVYSTSVEGDNVTYTLDLSLSGKYYLFRVYPYEVSVYEPGTFWGWYDDPEKWGISFESEIIDVDRLFLSPAVSDFLIDFQLINDLNPSMDSANLEVLYLSDDYRLLKQEFIDAEAGATDMTFSVSYTPVVPVGTAYVQFICTEIFTPVYGGIYKFELDYFDYSFTVPISSVENQEVLDKLEEQGQVMDDILGEQLDTNNKLDDIINGEVDPELPEGSDSIADLEDAEGALRDDAQAGLDQGVQIQQNAFQILEQFANGFAVFSWIFGLFAKIPFFSGLLYVSLALGTVAVILGIGFTVARSSAGREAAASYRMAAQWKKGG